MSVSFNFRYSNCGKGVFRYHAYMNPSSRRNGSHDFNSLLEDLRSRRLCRACESLAKLFASDSVAGPPTYTRALQVLKDSGVKLFARECMRTRFEHESGCLVIKFCFVFCQRVGVWLFAWFGGRPLHILLALTHVSLMHVWCDGGAACLVRSHSLWHGL